MPDDLENARVLYKEYGDQTRHFSTVRSALTTFLLTVSVTAFAAYFDRTKSSYFLIVAGFTALIAGVIVCRSFSYETEKAVLRYTHAWKVIEGKIPLGETLLHDPPEADVKKRVNEDKMNLLLSGAAAVVAVAFIVCAIVSR